MIQRTTLVAALVVLASVGAVGVAAQAPADEAPIYENNTSDPNTDRWLDGTDPDLPGVVALLGRVGTFVVGGGASGIEGALLSGVLVLGLGVGTVARSGVGSIAGGTLAVAGVMAGVATGIAPTWVAGAVLFGIGLVVASVFRRIIS